MPKETKLYDLLGTTSDASSNDLKKAYRKKALTLHPDKPTGNEEEFKKISYAYEVLSNPEKRDIYDKHGEEGLKEGPGGGGQSAHDIFEMFFGGGGRSAKDSTKTKDVVFEMEVTLEDLYNGTSRNIALNKDVICPMCNGIGGTEGKVAKCSICDGNGITIQLQQLLPGIMQQSRVKCSHCSGAGEVIPEKHKCRNCNGKKIKSEDKVLKVHIDPGMTDGQKIVFHQEADQKPGKTPGDVIVVLDEKKHEEFRRKGLDLIMNMEVPLIEAICGFDRPIKTLDNRYIVVSTIPGEIIKPGDIKAVPNEGMPRYKTLDKGRLIIKFFINFPKDHSLPDKSMDILRTILPERDPIMNIEQAMEVPLEDISPESETPEQEYPDGARRVECQTS